MSKFVVPDCVRLVTSRTEIPQLDLSAICANEDNERTRDAGFSPRVRAWLEELGLQECVPAFEAHGISAESLLEISEEGQERLQQLGVVRLDDRF